MISRFPLILIVLVAAACQSSDDERRLRTAWVDKQDTRLVFNAPELEKATQRFQRFVNIDGSQVEEFGEWYVGADKSIIAGLILSESTKGPPLTDPEDPQDIPAMWSAFSDQVPAFGDLKQTSNVLGPALWRRMGVGTRSCVVFLQRWTFGGRSPSTSASSPITGLSGYYCGAPGQVFPPDLAERVIQGVGLSPGLAPLPKQPASQ